MAVARCDKHGPPVELKSSFGHRHVLKESGRCMCGRALCTQPADVWLSDAEQGDYTHGERFYGVGQGHKVIEVM
jgi:hypothetical protein